MPAMNIRERIASLSDFQHQHGLRLPVANYERASDRQAGAGE